MEDITDTDYTHGKRVSKDFKIKKIKRILWFLCSKQCITVSWCIGRHWKYGLEKYEFHSAPFLTAKRLVNSLKNYQSKIRYFNDINMMFMVEKVLEEEYVTLFIDMQKPITNTWKIMIKIKNRHILKIWAVSQNIPVNDPKNIEDISKFDKSLVEIYNTEIDLG